MQIAPIYIFTKSGAEVIILESHYDLLTVRKIKDQKTMLVPKDSLILKSKLEEQND